MSGTDSSARAGAAAELSASAATPLNFSVHSLPSPDEASASRRTAKGRLKMLGVLLVCVAPVVASYLAYFVVRPEGRTNYSELVVPARPIPETMQLADLAGRTVAPASLRGQWLLVVVAGAACDARCERHLFLQRQLHEGLGREKERVDKLWLIDDSAPPRPQTLAAIVAEGSTGTGAGTSTGNPATVARAPFAPAHVLRASRESLGAWLAAASGQALEDHLYIVDPQGDWMMRAPADADPKHLKADLDKLLRASAGWDRPGR